jgi:FLVCR family MFS transporter 7
MITDTVYFTFVIGGATSYISTVTALNEEIMCALGYSNHFSGLCSALVIIGGLVGALFFGTLSRYLSRHNLWVTRCGLLLQILLLVGLSFVMRLPFQHALFASGYTLAGFIAIG